MEEARGRGGGFGDSSSLSSTGFSSLSSTVPVVKLCSSSAQEQEFCPQFKQVTKLGNELLLVTVSLFFTGDGGGKGKAVEQPVAGPEEDEGKTRIADRLELDLELVPMALELVRELPTL